RNATDSRSTFMSMTSAAFPSRTGLPWSASLSFQRIIFSWLVKGGAYDVRLAVNRRHRAESCFRLAPRVGSGHYGWPDRGHSIKDAHVGICRGRPAWCVE